MELLVEEQLIRVLLAKQEHYEAITKCFIAEGCVKEEEKALIALVEELLL